MRFDHPAPQVVLQDYIHAVEDAEARVERLASQIEDLLPNWSMRTVVETVQAHGDRARDGRLHLGDRPARAGGVCHGVICRSRKVPVVGGGARLGNPRDLL